MCDYSLHRYPNRLAVEGEDLIAYRFGRASLGLASPADVGAHIAENRCEAAPWKFWSWTGLKEWFKAQRPEWEAEKRIPAVCVPPGARLLVKDIPKCSQRELGVSQTEEVIFVEITAEVNTHHDAIQFKNGRRMLLQALCEGQRVTVLSLGPTEADRGVHSAAIRVEELARTEAHRKRAQDKVCLFGGTAVSNAESSTAGRIYKYHWVENVMTETGYVHGYSATRQSSGFAEPEVIFGIGCESKIRRLSPEC